MNINYFINVNTVEELKQAYRKLAKQYHPDLNDYDTNKIMSDINNEYDFLFEKLKHKKAATGDNEENSNDQHEDMFKDIISKLVIYDGLIIDIVGTWIWLSGNTYPYKDQIKEIGFKWSKKNKRWYLGEVTGKRRKAISWDEKVNKYGLKSMKSEGLKMIG